MRKKKLKLWQISLIIIGIIFLVLLGIILFYPISNKILEDRPILTLICKINPLTRVSESVGCYTCDNENHYTFRWVEDWPGYYGCNESTKGYNNEGKICNLSSCGGITIT